MKNLILLILWVDNVLEVLDGLQKLYFPWGEATSTSSSFDYNVKSRSIHLFVKEEL